MVGILATWLVVMELHDEERGGRRRGWLDFLRSTSPPLVDQWWWHGVGVVVVVVAYATVSLHLTLRSALDGVD